jgi:UDP-N-acetylglucosamine 2-epimerase
MRRLETMKIISVVGSRAQLVKAAAVAAPLARAGIRPVVVAGRSLRHENDLLRTWHELQVGEPEYVVRFDDVRSDVIQLEVAEILFGEDPDVVLVYGDDPRSTLPAARAAVEAGVPLAHVEAGVRNDAAVAAEEHTRTEIDRISSLLFLPDQRARWALVAEGARGELHVVGDVMADLMRLHRSTARKRYGLPWQPDAYVVASVRRQENRSGDRLQRILSGLNRVRSTIVFPADVQLRGRISGQRLRVGPGLKFVEPLSYFEFIALASGARAVVTDSGGVQKEAYWLGVPCITLRRTTEWPDTVATGGNVLVDDDPDAIAAAAATAEMPREQPRLYGDGHAAERIAATLVGWHSRTAPRVRKGILSRGPRSA